MFELVSLEFSNFRSFKEPVKITFPKSGALLVSGTYTDSSVSSGSGKSSVLMALAYALGFCNVPATELKTRGTKNLSVKLTFRNGDVTYGITRDPKMQLTVFDESGQSGETLHGADAEAKLSKIFGADMELVKVLTYRAQEDSGVFIGKSDADKKEMLYTLLGLNDIEIASRDISFELAGSTTAISNSKSVLTTLQQNLPSFHVEQSEVNRLHEELSAANARLGVLQNVDLSALNGQLALVDQELQKITHARTEVHCSTSNIQQCRQAILSLKADYVKVSEGVCPTCTQKWASASVQMQVIIDKIGALEGDIVKHETIIEQANTLINFLPRFTEDKKQLMQAIASTNQPKQDAERALLSAGMAYKQVCARVEQYSAMINQFNAAQAQLAGLEANHVILEHTAKIVSREGFGSDYADGLLQEIEYGANNLIKDIPNVCEFVLRIDSTSTTKAGIAKKSISVVLFKEGQEVSLKSLSGGQRCAIDLSVDLSISGAIRRRSGIKIGWVALDEAMDGLDIETKRSMIEVIKRNIEGLCILVDHASEIKDSFEQVIAIDFDGTYSTIG